MKIFFSDNNPSVEQLHYWLTPHGDYKVTNNPFEVKDADFIICWGVTQMGQAQRIHNSNKHVPLINYNWDIYEWAIKTPRPGEYNYKEYIQFLSESTEVWCPSKSVEMRTHQWIAEAKLPDVDTHVILSHAPHYDDHPASDQNFVFNTQRENPDERLGWFEKACEELQIPYKSSKHQMDRGDYHKAMAECTFQVSAYYEMSTGGLGILEGYYHGKPVLLSNSKWQGGGDYMGKRAVYFQHDSFEDLKAKIKDMWENRNKYKVDVTDARKWLKKNYSEEAMGKRIHDRLTYLYERRKNG